MNKLTRTIYPEVRVVDAERGIVDYVASDQTLDSYREVIMASGWKFTNFSKNAPFVDSHNYASIDCLIGRVVEFRVENKQLIERVQWAIDVPENKLAQIGWKMTAAGYLKAVSVGFYPTRYVTKWDNDPDGYNSALKDLGIADPSKAPTCIYLEQEQCELSACIIGANPNALAKSAKLTDAECQFLVDTQSQRDTPEPSRASVPAAFDSGLAAWASDQTRQRFVRKIRKPV